MVYRTKLSASIGWQDTQASPTLCYGPQFFWGFLLTCHHQRDVYNGKCLVTPGLHARQLIIVVANVNSGWLMWSIGLVISRIRSFWYNLITVKKLCGLLSLSSHIRLYFTHKFNSNKISWLHGERTRVLTTHRISNPRCSPAFVRVDYKSKYCNKTLFLLRIDLKNHHEFQTK